MIKWRLITVDFRAELQIPHTSARDEKTGASATVLLARSQES